MERFLCSFLIWLLCLLGVCIWAEVDSISYGKPEKYCQEKCDMYKANLEYTSHSKSEQKLLVPSIDEVKQQGYPKNEMGETYGPDIKEFDCEPDLILVQHGGVYGYIRRYEIDGNIPSSPEDVVKKTKNRKIREVNIYLHDGKTCIGSFILQP